MLTTDFIANNVYIQLFTLGKVDAATIYATPIFVFKLNIPDAITCIYERIKFVPKMHVYLEYDLDSAKERSLRVLKLFFRDMTK